MDAATLSAAKIIGEALRIAPLGPGLDESAERVALALSEMGYVIHKAPKPRAAAPRRVVETFAPNTGDRGVDAFMRAHHNPRRKLLPLPKAPGLPALRPMKVSEQDAAERDWRGVATDAREDIAHGVMPAVEKTLRELISLHRNPWTRVGAQRDGHCDVTIYESARHRGIQIHQRIDRSRWGDSTPTYEVYANGERRSGVHYSSKVAESFADGLVAAVD